MKSRTEELCAYAGNTGMALYIRVSLISGGIFYIFKNFYVYTHENIIYIDISLEIQMGSFWLLPVLFQVSIGSVNWLDDDTCTVYNRVCDIFFYIIIIIIISFFFWYLVQRRTLDERN